MEICIRRLQFINHKSSSDCSGTGLILGYLCPQYTIPAGISRELRIPQNKKCESSNAKERENERKTGDKEVEGVTFHSWLTTHFRKHLPTSSPENTPSSLSGNHLFISNLLLSIYHEPGTELDPETTELSDTWPLSSRNHRMLRNEQR